MYLVLVVSPFNIVSAIFRNSSCYGSLVLSSRFSLLVDVFYSCAVFYYRDSRNNLQWRLNAFSRKIIIDDKLYVCQVERIFLNYTTFNFKHIYSFIMMPIVLLTKCLLFPIYLRLQVRWCFIYDCSWTFTNIHSSEAKHFYDASRWFRSSCALTHGILFFFPCSLDSFQSSNRIPSSPIIAEISLILKTSLSSRFFSSDCIKPPISEFSLFVIVN